ncbi:hypothetical protein F0562_026003 [Nyssa sinensis]|uniref:Uncharacterized protein n=1 Tax=Nyssa sinensis TaxID=561372 RepID=A0A5J5BDL4_9ASTE|nr:hypothetical protein F0562_026003 [Nyssa sinensis]
MLRLDISDFINTIGAANSRLFESSRPILKQGSLNPSLIPCPSRSDYAQWNLKSSGEFSSKSAWEKIRGATPIVDWFDIVWSSNSFSG